MKTIKIHESDYKDKKYQMFTDEQLVLAILKDKGAPVKGRFLLSPDTENYEWKVEKDQLRNYDVFTVFRKQASGESQSERV